MREELLEKGKAAAEEELETERRKNDSALARLEVLTETSRNFEILQSDIENLQRQLKNSKVVR